MQTLVRPCSRARNRPDNKMHGFSHSCNVPAFPIDAPRPLTSTRTDPKYSERSSEPSESGLGATQQPASRAASPAKPVPPAVPGFSRRPRAKRPLPGRGAGKVSRGVPHAPRTCALGPSGARGSREQDAARKDRKGKAAAGCAGGAPVARSF